MLEYLPQQLTKSENLESFRETVGKLGTNSMRHVRKVMFASLPKVIGKADGKLVSEIVKQYLNK